jgi:hypothetical protein
MEKRRLARIGVEEDESLGWSEWREGGLLGP